MKKISNWAQKWSDEFPELGEWFATFFVTGQLTEAIILGTLYFIGMTSVLVGFTALIPIFEPFFGTAIGAFMILIFAVLYDLSKESVSERLKNKKLTETEK